MPHMQGGPLMRIAQLLRNKSVQEELDLTVDYSFEKGFLKGLWLRARGAYLDQEGPNARDVSNIRLILNYDLQIL